jgi:SAM-dependent methyltransferase
MNCSIETYKIFADFYDLYVGKFSTDYDFYKSNCTNTDKIIEIGCGTGRILEYLLRLNLKVTGVDISQEMLDKAQMKLRKWISSGDLSLINHNFTTGKLETRFDKALLTFYTFNYIHDDPKDFLFNIHESLNENGLLLMDLFYPNSLFDRSINDKWLGKKYTIDGTLIKIRDKRKMIDDIEYRQQIFNINKIETKIDTERKYYSPMVLCDLLKFAGFKQIEFSFDYDLNGFSSMIDDKTLENNYIVRAKK